MISCFCPSLLLSEAPFPRGGSSRRGRLNHWKFGEPGRPPRDMATRGRRTMCRMGTLAAFLLKLLSSGLSRWVIKPLVVGCRAMGAQQVPRSQNILVGQQGLGSKRRRANLCLNRSRHFSVIFLLSFSQNIRCFGNMHCLKPKLFIVYGLICVP